MLKYRINAILKLSYSKIYNCNFFKLINVQEICVLNNINSSSLFVIKPLLTNLSNIH